MLVLIAHALRTAGYRVRTATDGAEALDRLGRDDFALIVCDVLMPGLTGRSFGQQLATQPKHPPILFVSAADVVPGSLPGAFLKKPFSPAALVAVVRELLARNHP